MKMQKKGISNAIIASAVIVVIVLVIAAYAVYSTKATTTTATVIGTTTYSVVATSTLTSTSIGTTTATSIATTTATTTATSTATSIATTTATTTKTATSTTTSTATSTTTTGAPLLSYSADAYAIEVTALLNGFSKSTGVQVAPVVSGGSTADASAIEAGAPDDVFVSASLTAMSPSNLGSDSSNWAIGFATDQLVLAYANSTTQTAATNNIISLANTAIASNATSDWNNFYTALVGGSVKIGISAPTQDPAGLRAWILLEIAGQLYTGNQQTYVSKLLSDGANVTASSAANLVAPLQSGQIQFLFTYKSAAVSNSLNYITLNSHVNLGTPSLGTWYSGFSYTDSAGTTKGAAIIIGVTIPVSAVNVAEAIQFVQYIVNNVKTLSSYGLVVVQPVLLYGSSNAPTQIQALVTQGLAVNNGALP